MFNHWFNTLYSFSLPCFIFYWTAAKSSISCQSACIYPFLDISLLKSLISMQKRDISLAENNLRLLSNNYCIRLVPVMLVVCFGKKKKINKKINVNKRYRNTPLLSLSFNLFRLMLLLTPYIEILKSRYF